MYQIPIIEMAKLGQTEAIIEWLNTYTQKNDLLNIDEEDDEGNYAILIAARRNDLETLKILVDHGANRDVADVYGRNALYWAKENGNAEMQVLLKAPAKKMSEDESMTTENSSPFKTISEKPEEIQSNVDKSEGLALYEPRFKCVKIPSSDNSTASQRSPLQFQSMFRKSEDDYAAQASAGFLEDTADEEPFSLTL
ncbi:ankyrin repeat protein [Legionella busanensis]|uniref:Ankyrin repeat protein n=1 Tax=Legionella busanensis TaxID=190655 RepID=A0A378K937_9GAMM|nr:ankyrin repeat domain-containing protein [Legionella busanensis]STX81227.1 ankyrin repeat protein [Legionella busanensis]